MEEYKNGKIERVLGIYTKLLNGYIVNKAAEANEYGVNERSIQRDVDDIRNYLELEAVNSGCINNVIYDRLNKGYRLEKVQKRSLTDEEIVEICKILLKSQEIDSQEMSKMVEKLISSCVTKNNKKIILELINQK
jgi:predicted DNA-binding transcriptional regulator YafY